MSDLRKKKSAHQRHRETLEAGEWSSGRKWTDDSASEVIYPETVTLMSIGSCGAFIHGLEDEFYGTNYQDNFYFNTNVSFTNRCTYGFIGIIM